jgi:RNA polymerase sigma factor (sigma-70 family)
VRLPPFQTILDAHRDDVYRFLVSVVGPQEADDCFQETFLSALRAYPRLTDETNLKGWVLTIAYRKAMDSYRARKRHPVPVEQLPERPDDGSIQDTQALWDVVRTLPAKQRAAVTHRYANGLPYRDIAQIVGGTEEAARQNVREGLKKLKELTK